MKEHLHEWWLWVNRPKSYYAFFLRIGQTITIALAIIGILWYGGLLLIKAFMKLI